MEMCELIKEIRSQLGMSQEAFADAIHVAFSTVNRWERGHSEPQFLERRKFDNFCKKHEISFVEGEG